MSEEIKNPLLFRERRIQVLVIDHDVSDEIIGHNRVRGVTMTGSDGAGRHIGQKATQHLKKSVLELGSNDAYLVLEDADVELAVSSQEQFDKLSEQVEKSIAGGAELLCGGKPPERVGYYFPATVLVNCKPGTPAFDDELFGPVASVIKARDDEHAMRIANDSRYGLGGGIFTSDESKAVKLARDHFDTGMIRINSFGTADPNMPFGGVKDSGFGREHGGSGMKEFVNVKGIYLP